MLPRGFKQQEIVLFLLRERPTRSCSSSSCTSTTSTTGGGFGDMIAWSVLLLPARCMECFVRSSDVVVHEKPDARQVATDDGYDVRPRRRLVNAQQLPQLAVKRLVLPHAVLEVLNNTHVTA